MAKPYNYGHSHRLERKKWEPVVEAGQAYCAEPVCVMPNRWIPPGSRWHLCHDPTGTVWIGVGHGRCNEAESARRNNPKRAAKRTRWAL